MCDQGQAWGVGRVQAGLTSLAATQNRLSEMGLGVGKAVDGIGFRELPRLDRGTR